MSTFEVGMDDGCFEGVEEKLFLVANFTDPWNKIRNWNMRFVSPGCSSQEP